MDAATASTNSCCYYTISSVAALVSDASGGSRSSDNKSAGASAVEYPLSDGDRLSIALWVYAGATIAALGVAGHAVAAAALLSSRTLRALPISVFLLAMFAAGASALCVGLVRQIVHHQTHYEVDVRDLAATEAGCDVHAMLTYASLQYYAWLQATAAVERLVSAARPHAYRRWFTPRLNAWLALGELVVLIALNTPLAAAHGYDEAQRSCVTVDRWLLNDVWGYVDLCLYAILPAAVLLPCDAAIVVYLHGRRRKLATTVHAAAGPSASWTSNLNASRSSQFSSERLRCGRLLLTPQSSVLPPSPPTSPTHSRLASSSSMPPSSPAAPVSPVQLPMRSSGRRRHRARPVTIALLAINGVFLASTLPVSVLFLLPWPTEKGSPADDTFVLLWTVFNLLQYAGCSACSIAYFALGSKFRQSVTTPVKRLFGSVRLNQRGVEISSPSTIVAESPRLGCAASVNGTRHQPPWSKPTTSKPAELRRVTSPLLPPTKD